VKSHSGACDCANEKRFEFGCNHQPLTCEYICVVTSDTAFARFVMTSSTQKNHSSNPTTNTTDIADNDSTAENVEIEAPTPEVQPTPTVTTLTDAAEYCIGWRQTVNCDPTAAREPESDISCEKTVFGNRSGLSWSSSWRCFFPLLAFIQPAFMLAYEISLRFKSIKYFALQGIANAAMSRECRSLADTSRSPARNCAEKTCYDPGLRPLQFQRV
jgi:hypothetical protein